MTNTDAIIASLRTFGATNLHVTKGRSTYVAFSMTDDQLFALMTAKPVTLHFTQADADQGRYSLLAS